MKTVNENFLAEKADCPARPRPQLLRDITGLCRLHSEEALKNLVTLMRKSEDENIRLKACESILNRAYGKPSQSVLVDSVHRLLCDQIQLLDMEDFYSITENEIRGANGTLFSFTGFHHNSVGKLKSYEGYDILWVEEGQNCSEKSWRIMLPTIRKPDSEIWISFNPDLEEDPTYTRFVVNKPDNCISVEMNYVDNPFFPKVLEDERLYTLTHNPADYANIWEGKPRTLAEGAIFGKEMDKVYEDKRIGTYDYDPTQAVFTAFDIGVRDSTAVWFSMASRLPRLRT